MCIIFEYISFISLKIFSIIYVGLYKVLLFSSLNFSITSNEYFIFSEIVVSMSSASVFASSSKSHIAWSGSSYTTLSSFNNFLNFLLYFLILPHIFSLFSK